jgi:hypothetical protein
VVPSRRRTNSLGGAHEDSTFVFSDLNTWGWIVTALGVGLLAASFTVLSGSQLARWFGVGAAFLNSMGQLFFMAAYPLWSITMFAGPQLRGEE